MLKFCLLALILALTIAGETFSQSRAQLTPTNRPAVSRVSHTHPAAITVARLHYGGGGDWYWGGSALPNFLKYVRDNSNFVIDTLEKTVQVMDDNLFRYPFLFATGHGLIKFSDEERERLRLYLNAGGFLFINDSYGMEKSVRDEINALFPERELVELPFEHQIYHSYFDMPAGPPKIHEHDNKPPRGYAVIINGRVVLYYLLESDIGDGWEDFQVHNDPPEKREAAFQMGMNILVYALNN